MRRPYTLLLIFLALAVPGWGLGDSPELSSLASVLKDIPVQSGGRMKPLDTLARESVRAVTGKASWQGEEPVLTVMDWWADPERTQQADLIFLTDVQAKAELGLDTERRWFSARELLANGRLAERREQIQRRLRNDEELPKSDRAIRQLMERIVLLAALADGSGLKIVPHPGGMEQPWSGLDEVPESSPAMKASQHLREELRYHRPGARLAAVEFKSEMARLGPGPSSEKIQKELWYNSKHPFRAAWVLYLSAFLVLIAGSGQSVSGNLHRLGMSLAATGFLVHLYGFYLRCSIAGRPPVTNMYESVIWVALGAVGFAFALRLRSPRGIYLPAACGCATLCLILADSLPSVLDPSIHPLTPVLRSNYWLTVHVLSITLGYAAFLLALGIGHVALWKAANQSPRESVDPIHDAVYKSVQLGVLFLAAGTILGGVWANDSWGRFWGWDPKEVWALIALLGYLAILHGRYAGWLRKFGVTAWSVLAFQGVMMAWYGVNYVLGAGLHSYGFGTGGGVYVAGFVAFEFCYVGWAVSRYHQILAKLRQTHEGGCPFTRLASLFSQPHQGETR